MRVSRECPICHELGTIEDVDSAKWRMWKEGTLIQEAFPDKSPEWREQLLSGTHPECFAKAFPPEEPN